VTEVKIRQPKAPEWIKTAEQRYGGKYIGLYDLPDREGPFHVFYQPNPDVSKGHSHYFGLFTRHLDPTHLYITNAASIVGAKFPAVRLSNGVVITSRYVHDYVEIGGAMLDGGLAYTRCFPSCPPTGHIEIVEAEERYVPNP
jgi:hypothetical protein